MATSYKGRSSSSRSSWARQSGFGAWGRSNNSTGTSSSYSASPRGAKSASASSSQYRSVGQTFAKKIDAYKTLYAQTQSGGKWGRPTPATLNSFANWISKGAIVQTVSPTQIARWARSYGYRFNQSNPSPTTCKAVLCHKYSKSVIKAVCLTKNGHFMVATSPTWNGKSFTFSR